MEISKMETSRKKFISKVFLYHHGLKLLNQDSSAYIHGKDIIDVGASLGDSACILSEYSKSGKIYSFDADKNTFDLLKKTIHINNLSTQVIPIKLAVGKKTGAIKFDGFPRDFYFHNKQKRIYKMKCVSIDDFFKNTNANIGLIKMDIEGFEYEALQGATRTIKRFKPMIIASIYHTGKDFFEIPKLLQKCCSDYRFRFFLLNEESPLKEATLIAF